MASNPITVEEILQPLNEEERNEISQHDFKTPLDYYLEGYNTNPQTTETVRQEAIAKIRLIARKRVAVRNGIKKNPDILKTRVDDPLVIIGLHRSGTTLLNRMLACDDQFLAPMLWEMMELLPAGRPQNWRECERYHAATKSYQRNTYNVEGALDAAHVYKLESPEACMVILMDHFLELPEVHYVRSMEKFKEFVYKCSSDHVKKAYEYYKQCLQCINYQSNKRLLVKAGIHLLYINVMKKVFPNAKFVLLLRNAKEIIPSLGSLASWHGKMKGFTDDKMGWTMLEYFGLITSNAVDFVKTTPNESYIAIEYLDLIKDPMTAVRNIYSHFNFNLKPETVELMRNYIAENPQNKHGKHKYSIEDFGITIEDIQTNLKEYQEHFKDRTDLAL